MTRHSSEPTSHADAFDELAALFLTDDGESASSVSHSEPAFRELLIVGNLPVRGGVWLTPYADAIARQNGPTALVRFDMEPPTIELFRMDGSIGSGPLNGTPERVDQRVRSRARTFMEVVERAAQEVAVWIVRGRGGVAEMRSHIADFDRITILTSADSAAVVAAYQILKEIVSSVDELDEEPQMMPRLGFAIAGAEERDALEVVRRLNETASTGLGVSVELSHCLPRMDAGIQCETFASFEDAVKPTMTDLLSWLDAQSSAASSGNGVHADDELVPWSDGEQPILRLAPMVDDDAQMEREALLGSGEPADAANELEDDLCESERDLCCGDDDRVEGRCAEVAETLDDVAEAVHSIEGRSMSGSSPDGEAPPLMVETICRNSVRLAPKALTEGSAASAQDQIIRDETATPALASCLEGLVKLAVRCPGHEAVELAADADGRIHVLAREHLLRELRIVETWVHAHRQLIAMACAECEIDSDAEVVCHLFTNEPATLADLHGTGLSLHVLAPVTVAGRTAWYSAPLSR